MKFLTAVAVAALVAVAQTQQVHVFGPEAVVTESSHPDGVRRLQTEGLHQVYLGDGDPIRNLQLADDGIVPIEIPHDHPDYIRLLQYADDGIVPIEIPHEHPDFIRLLQDPQNVKPRSPIKPERIDGPVVGIDSEFGRIPLVEVMPEDDQWMMTRPNPSHEGRKHHQIHQGSENPNLHENGHQPNDWSEKPYWGMPDQFQEKEDNGSYSPYYDYGYESQEKRHHRGKHCFVIGLFWVSLIAIFACCLVKCCCCSKKCGRGKKNLEKLSLDLQMQHHRSELNRLQGLKNRQLQNAHAINPYDQYRQQRAQPLPVNPYSMPVEQSYEQERIAFGMRPPVSHNQRSMPIPVGRPMPENSYENGYPSI